MEYEFNEKQKEFFEHIYQALVDLDTYMVNEECISSEDPCFEFACDVCETLNDVMYWIDGAIH